MDDQIAQVAEFMGALFVGCGSSIALRLQKYHFNRWKLAQLSLGLKSTLLPLAFLFLRARISVLERRCAHKVTNVLGGLAGALSRVYDLASGNLVSYGGQQAIRCDRRHLKWVKFQEQITECTRFPGFQEEVG